MRTVLITGAGGGLGGATARLFAERGWRVLAADLQTPEAAPGIVPLTVDVTDAASVAKLAAAVEEHAPDGLGAVVTFAGIMLVGAMVDVDEDDLRRILDVNVLGTYRVTKAMYESVLRGHGRIVTISSETGWQSALMLNGPYAMTKHAIEAYSDALRRELMFRGVPVIKVQPGPFRTDMVGGIPAAFARAGERATHFAKLTSAVGRMAAGEEKRAAAPERLAQLVWRAVTAPRPRTAYRVNTDVRRAVMHYLPARVTDGLLRAALRRHA